MSCVKQTRRKSFEMTACSLDNALIILGTNFFYRIYQVWATNQNFSLILKFYTLSAFRVMIEDLMLL